MSLSIKGRTKSYHRVCRYTRQIWKHGDGMNLKAKGLTKIRIQTIKLFF